MSSDSQHIWAGVMFDYHQVPGSYPWVRCRLEGDGRNGHYEAPFRLSLRLIAPDQRGYDDGPVHLFVSDPGRRGASAQLEVLYEARRLERELKVSLGPQGSGTAVLHDLVRGNYTVRFQGQSQDACSFRYGPPEELDWAGIPSLLDVSAEPDRGIFSKILRPDRPAPNPLRFALLSSLEPRQMAELAGPNEAVACGFRLRELGSDWGPSPPFKLGSFDADRGRGTLIVLEPLLAGAVAVIDPSGMDFDPEMVDPFVQSFGEVAAGFELHFRAVSTMAIVTFGAIRADGTVWEGYTIVLEPDPKALDVRLPESARAGDLIDLEILGLGDAGAYVVVKDARLYESPSPGALLRERLLKIMQEARARLRVGPIERRLAEFANQADARADQQVRYHQLPFVDLDELQPPAGLDTFSLPTMVDHLRGAPIGLTEKEMTIAMAEADSWAAAQFGMIDAIDVRTVIANADAVERFIEKYFPRPRGMESFDSDLGASAFDRDEFSPSPPRVEARESSGEGDIPRVITAENLKVTAGRAVLQFVAPHRVDELLVDIHVHTGRGWTHLQRRLPVSATPRVDLGPR